MGADKLLAFVETIKDHLNRKGISISAANVEMFFDHIDIKFRNETYIFSGDGKIKKEIKGND